MYIRDFTTGAITTSLDDAIELIAFPDTYIYIVVYERFRFVDSICSVHYPRLGNKSCDILLYNNTWAKVGNEI